ncbi:beta-1,3-N-acetylglucosaminyltransferase radical fringe-like isoform X2 [Gouania willdenowi]|uniref:beta-1,3-N-acetylglucosaminyltransferase radical fringe-like isoform X2 n=1 Tax=Gouania willdenowi TaxID=441366 RepID=UPI0010552448|nr:beta-1,3-N-acetylglucosaminyltransferase radical fringe-like isoform X2 [Gouania willdenowi]
MKPVKMQKSSVSANKFCFLLILTFCGLLLLFPILKPQTQQENMPKPRPHIKPFRTTLASITRNSSHPGGADMSMRLQPSSSDKENDMRSRLRNDNYSSTLESMSRRGSGSSAKEKEVGGHLVHGSSDQLDLKDVFIAVKTTKKYHKSRLELLTKTWVSRAKEQTFIFTDGEDQEFQQKTECNIINTNCSAAHTRQALCCKMSVEYDKFIDSQKKLLQLLSSYHHSQDVYLGRPSLDHPVEATETEGPRPVKFWFATGGAGFCISRGLALKMSPWASFGNFISTAEKIRLPDDCTIGYIIEALLEVTLTHTHLFHSHLENLQKLPTESVLHQVTLSYGGYENRRNVVSIFGGFTMAEDPTRFKTVHCLLYPDTQWCSKILLRPK